MKGQIIGKRIAIIATNGVEQSELTEPRDALVAAGAHTELISPEPEKICAWKDNDWGESFPVDLPIGEATVESYDALLLPGGVKNPDTLRMNDEVVQLVKNFVSSGKPIAAICHGPVLLIEADAVRGKKVTSYPSIKTDLINAGATWQDSEVCTDQGIVTSRTPADIPAFVKKFIEEISEGVHSGRNTKKKAA